MDKTEEKMTIHKLMQADIAQHLHDMEKWFGSRCRLTFLVRNIDNDESDFILTTDEHSELKKMIDRIVNRTKR